MKNDVYWETYLKGGVEERFPVPVVSQRSKRYSECSSSENFCWAWPQNKNYWNRLKTRELVAPNVGPPPVHHHNLLINMLIVYKRIIMGSQRLIYICYSKIMSFQPISIILNLWYRTTRVCFYPYFRSSVGSLSSARHLKTSRTPPSGTYPNIHLQIPPASSLVFIRELGISCPVGLPPGSWFSHLGDILKI